MRYFSFILAILLMPMAVLAQADQEVQINNDGTASATYQFKNQGIFGCNMNGSYAMSVGTTAAIGGVYVPVNDAAVTLNTGMLIYKECVLRQVIDAEAAAALAGQAQQLLLNVYQNNLFVQDFWGEYAQRQDEARADALTALQASQFTDPKTQQKVIRYYAQQYLAQKKSPIQNRLGCPNKDSIPAYQAGRTGATLGQILSAFDTRCLEIWTAIGVQDYSEQLAREREQEAQFWLQTGNGFYAKQSVGPNGERVTETPSYVVAQNTNAALQSGWQRMVNANDVGQMTTALFSGLINQAVSVGLSKLAQKTGNQPSYLNQMTAEQSALVRSNAVNAALQILAAARQIETGFMQAYTAMAQTLTNTIAQLRSGEKQCWAKIISAACSDTPAADNTCTPSSPSSSCTVSTEGTSTCVTAGKLKIATTTAFSQAVINEKITPLAQPALDKVKEGQNSVKLVDQMIAGVTNTNSLDAQRLALQQLDSLVSQRKIHNQYDLQTAQKNQQALTDSMQTLVQDTVKAWADNTDPSVGWCNVNNSSVVELWKQRWKI